MTNGNIIFTRKDTAELVDRPMPEPKAGEVRVRLVRSCISSGTERANLTGVPDNAVGVFTDPDKATVTFPRRGGYSSSGIVDAVGEGVAGLKEGDRVAMSWTFHAQFVCVPAERAYPIPGNVSFADAAFAHISTFPMAAIRKCRLEIGEPSLVMGQGVLGQIAVMLLRAGGAAPIVAADPDAGKRETALRLGADYAFDPLAPDFAGRVKEVCRGGRKALEGNVDDDGAKVVVEVTGSGGALDTALDAAAPFARLALLGCTRDSNFTVNYYRKVHARGVTMVGAHTSARPSHESAAGWLTTRDDACAFLRLLSLGRISLKGFVAETHKPRECAEVYARLAKGGAFPVVQFDWTSQTSQNHGTSRT